ncbi:MAG: uroporphyrinogen-III synthase [Nitrosomonadales bacterium]|nr:uroporphyrinogen-III synthase [Nitrosomonadales bacterium]
MTDRSASHPLPAPLVGQPANRRNPLAGEGTSELHLDLPLAGLNIVVTRPREQAAALARHIQHLGGSPILFPLLEISPPADPRPLEALLVRLPDFQLAIFISPNAVRFAMAAIRADGDLPSSLRVATVGQGSAKALRELGVASVIAPQDKFDSEALLALPELQDVAGWRVVIFRGDGGRELLGDTLKARGAGVEYAECYHRAKPQQDTARLLDNVPDAFIVTSSEALGYFDEMLAGAAKRRLADVPLFVSHPRIAERARQSAWQNVITAEGGDDGLLAGLVAWAKNRI